MDRFVLHRGRQARPAKSSLRRLLSYLSLALITALPTSAHAAPARVALVHDQEPSPLELKTLTRLRAELVAAGFDVAEIERGTGDERDAAEAEPPVAGVFATIVIVPRAPDAADIWVADRMTGKTVVRRVQGGAGAENDVAAILAVRAVELLQASLLEALEPPSRRRETATAPPLPDDVAAWMQARRVSVAPAFGLEAGIGVLHSFAGVGPAFLPVLGFSYRLTPDVALALRAGGPTLAADLEAAHGSLAVRQKLVWLDVSYRVPVATGPVKPIVILGAGAHHLDVAGTARAPYEGKTDGAWSAMFDAGLGAMFALGPRVSLLADVRALLVTPQPIIRAAGVEIGNISRPSLLGRAAVEVAF